MQAQDSDLKYERNRWLRDAFTEGTPEMKVAVDRKLVESPFVPPARDYPSPVAADQSRAEAWDAARVQVGFDTIWYSSRVQTPHWFMTFDLLTSMTPKRSEGPRMAAVRVVLPKSWDLAVGSKKIEFLDSTTGLAAKLHVSSNPQTPSAIVLRGRTSTLAQAADELISACKDVEVFQLGELADFDFETKRLWPAIKDAPDGGSRLPAGMLDSIWVHKEIETYWIDKPYEETPRPQRWTQETFESYITTLVCGRLRPDLALSFYGHDGEDGRYIDTDGIRVGLIVRAFQDPSARLCVTPSVLKVAMTFLTYRGGHRASANYLFTLAENWGMPIDTEFFNIMLGGYVANGDTVRFHTVLRKMEAQYHVPNLRTWLHFLSLVQREDKRREIILAMYELGLFEDPATRRGIAAIMARCDSYTAWRNGKKLETFMADQAVRYGEDWFTVDALHAIVKEFFRFHTRDHPRLADFKPLLDKQTADGRKMDISIINLILEYCADARDWGTALWALARIDKCGYEPDDETYKHLLLLARNSRCANALGMVFFYGVIERKLRKPSRKLMTELILNQHPSPFWSTVKPRIFTKPMANFLEQNKVGPNSNPVAAVEAAIIHVCGGFKPVHTLSHAVTVVYRTMDRPLHQQLKDPVRVDLGMDVRSYIIRLRDLTGVRTKLSLRLNAHFRPDAMMRNPPAGVDSVQDDPREAADAADECFSPPCLAEADKR